MNRQAGEPRPTLSPQDWLPQPSLSSAPSPALKARLLATLAQSPPPTRRTISRQAVILVVGSWTISLMVFLLTGGARTAGRPLSLVAGTALGMTLIAGVVAWTVFGRGRSMLGLTRSWLIPSLIGSLALLLAWKILWSGLYAGAYAEWPERPGFRCLVLSLTLGLAPLVAFALARRSSDPTRPMLTGLASGFAIGCISSVLTDLWCPVGYIPHVILGHFLPILLLGGLGSWLGARLIAMSRNEPPVKRTPTQSVR